MTALTIRDVSDDAVRTMKIRAAQAGQSLQAYLRGLIEKEAAKLTVAEAVERARREATADVSTADILAAIDDGRAGRDSR
jgi:plasmid stability protein